MSDKYICLCNPHSSEWLVFDYVPGRERYAPNYGTPITGGPTPKEAIKAAEEMFGINPENVETVW